MAWDVEYTDEFGHWWQTLSEEEQEDVDATVRLLEEMGPHLPYPYSSGLTGSEPKHIRELRIQHAGAPIRILYAFDPRRVAILLLGGKKRGHDRWYDEYLPRAKKLYNEHLETLKKKGN